MKLNNVISYLYQVAPDARSIAELKDKINPAAIEAVLDTELAEKVGFDSGTSISEQVTAALENDASEAHLLAAILKENRDSNVITPPDVVVNGTEANQIAVDGLPLKDKTLEVRLGGDLVDVQATDEGKLQITPKAEIAENQQVVIYVKEDDKFVKLNLAPSVASSPEEPSMPPPVQPDASAEAGEGKGKGSIWKSIGRWSIFGVSLYSLLGIFRSEKNWLGIIAGAIGTGLTAFWGKIKGAANGEGAEQPQQTAAGEGTA